MMAFYALALASKNKYGKFSFQDIYPNNDVWQNYSSGAVEVIKALSPRDLKIERTKKVLKGEDGKDRDYYFHEVTDEGNFDFEQIINLVEEQERDSGDNEYPNKIRNFFLLQKS